MSVIEAAKAADEFKINALRDIDTAKCCQITAKCCQITAKCCLKLLSETDK